MLSSEGSILLIANPAAQNGNGAAAAQRAVGLLRAQLGEDAVVLARTAGPRHASEIAERAEGCSTVIALGGARSAFRPKWTKRAPSCWGPRRVLRT